MQPDLPLGWYKHISGNIIRVYGVLTCSDSQELMVLHGTQEPNQCIALANFTASIVVDGQLRQLYKFVSKYRPRNIPPRPLVQFSRRDIARSSMEGIFPQDRFAKKTQKINKTAANPYGLSKCELVVAEGIVLGLNAKGIAQRLYISHKTVDSHLSTIYHKLGIADNRKVCHIVVASSMLRRHLSG